MKVSYAWGRSRNILAFPHHWQWPARTEEWAYERCLAELPDNKFAQMLCFPWATLIDLRRKGGTEKIRDLLEVLKWTPPKITLVRATVMQHIYANDIFPLLKELGVTDLFWSHATKNEREIDGIRIHSFPLYPVAADSRYLSSDWKSPGERRYLYSFIGTYQPTLYLSEARQWIFGLPPSRNAHVEQRDSWHFEDAVYGEQIHGIPQSDQQILAREKQEEQFRAVISQSIFSLCPSGSGPNTIRLWESIHLGAIPVIISDRCRLPGDPALWERAAVFVPESREEVGKIPERLAAMARNVSEIDRRLAALRELSEQFSIDRLPPGVVDFFSRSWRSVVGR